MKTPPFIFTFAFVSLLLLTILAIVYIFRPAYSHSQNKKKHFSIIILLFLWVVYSLLALNGFFVDTIKITPPPFMPAVLATMIMAVYFALFYKPLKEFDEKGMKYAVALQSFRLLLELQFVWALSLGFLPVQMTFEGLNYDVLIGLSAPLIAYFGYYKKALPKWVLIGWNFAGLATLFTIVTVAILSAPTTFQTFTNEPHNTIVLTFPFIFIPFFLVPLALFGHLFALKRLFAKN